FMKPIQYKLLFPRVDRELLPLEEKFIITGERYIHAEIVVKRNFEECQKTGYFSFGKGGVSMRLPSDFIGAIGHTYKVSFKNKSEYIIIQLCWQEKLNDNELIVGAEILESSENLLNIITEEVLKFPGYATIPLMNKN
ncbi:MAG: hypothetical protein KDD34_07730, partial [Bdellovibrionales bacterium]|nr:hypothetical protein [Bdellovibrionales bacterium]